MPAGARPRAGSLDPQRLDLGRGPVVVPDQAERRIAERRPHGRGVHRGQVLGGLVERVAPPRAGSRRWGELSERKRTGTSPVLPSACRRPVGISA